MNVPLFVENMASIFDEPYAALYNNFPRKEVKPGKKQVADFHFVKTIGEGSFAAVLKVKEKETDREFAMKIMEKVLQTAMSSRLYNLSVISTFKITIFLMIPIVLMTC